MTVHDFVGSVLALAVALAAGGCGRAENGTRAERLSAAECEAIRRAEVFVKENGYTLAPAEPDRYVPGLLDRALPLERVMALRKNTFSPLAVGITDRTVTGEPGWTVAFAFTEKFAAQPPPNGQGPRGGRGGGVTVFEDGRIRMEHKDLLMANVQKAFADPTIVDGQCEPRGSGSVGRPSPATHD